MNNREKLNQFAKEVVDNTEGVSLIEFVDRQKTSRGLPSLLEPSPWQELSATNLSANGQEFIDWLIDLFKAENISGEMLFSYRDSKIFGQPDVMKVILSDSYNWVEPLWVRGKEFLFISIERKKAWRVLVYGSDYKSFKWVELENDDG